MLEDEHYVTEGSDLMPLDGDPARWRGIFAIPVTPFGADLSIDHTSLQRQVEFCIAAGVQGIVYPGVVSEFFALSESERRTATERVVAAAAGEVPVVVGVSATSGPVAAELSEHAAAINAQGVMATLPYVQHFFPPGADYVHDYFDRVSTASGLPVILQNARIGHPIPTEDLGMLLEALPTIRYLKQETSPSTHALSAAIDAYGGRLDGVFAGLGGIYLLSELERGAVGSMPAPPFVDILIRAYQHFISGHRNEAQTILRSLHGYFTYELLYNVAIIKEILVRRGVIETTECRVPVPHLDKVDSREIDILLEQVRRLGVRLTH